MDPFLLMCAAGVPWGIVYHYFNKRFGSFRMHLYLDIPYVGYAAAVYILLNPPLLDADRPFVGEFLFFLSVCGLGSCVGWLVAALFDDWWNKRKKRLKQKTSEALRKLVAKVKELAPAPNPLPNPA